MTITTQETRYNIKWQIDEDFTPGSLELDRVAGNLEGQKNRDQARFVVSFAKQALGSAQSSPGSSAANLGKDNDTYNVVASGDGESFFTLSVERVF